MGLALVLLWASGLGRPGRGLEQLLSGPSRLQAQRVASEFVFPDDLLILVREGTGQQRRTFVDELQARLAESPECFPDCLCRLDVSVLERRLLHFLEPRLLHQLALVLGGLGPRLRSGSTLLEWMGPSSSGGEVGMADFYLRRLQDCLKHRERLHWESPLEQVLSPQLAAQVEPFWEGRTGTYLELDDGTLLMLVRPKEPSCGQELRRILQDATRRNPQVQVELTGSLAIADEQGGSLLRHGLPPILAGLTALILALLFRLADPVRLAWTGLVVSLALLFHTALEAVTVGLGPVWLTATIVVLAQWLYLGLHYAVDHDSLHIRQVGLTALMTYLVLALFPEPLVASLGRSCFTATTLTLLGFLDLVPLLEQWGPRPAQKGLQPWLERTWPGRRPTRAILVCTALAVLVSVAQWERTHFSADPFEAADREVPSLQSERELKGKGGTTLFAMLLVPDLEKARQAEKILRGLDGVHETLSLARWVPPPPGADQQVDIQSIARVAREARIPRPLRLETASDLMALAPSSHSPGGPLDAARLVQEAGPGGLRDGLRFFQQHVLDDFSRAKRLLSEQEASPLSLAELPRAVQQRLVGRSGRPVVLVFPRRPAGGSLEAFAHQLQTCPFPFAVDRAGPALMVGELAGLTRQTVRSLPVVLGLGLVLGLVLQIRRLPQAFLTLLGPTLGMTFTLAYLSRTPGALNLLTWPAPIVVMSMGLSLSLSTLRRPRASLKALYPAVMVLGVSALLARAEHSGVAHLGFVVALGTGFNLLIAVVILPPLQAFVRALGLPRGQPDSGGHEGPPTIRCAGEEVPPQ